MRKDKEEIYKARKSGKSYAEISGLFRIPKSTLSEWFKNEKWSSEIKVSLAEKNLNESKRRIVALDIIRGEKLELLYQEAEKEASQDFEQLKDHPLFISGLMIYWGEGNKLSKYACSIANSEPEMIQIYLQFLQRVCGLTEPKIKAWLLLYPDLDELGCKKYWVKEAGLTETMFNKSIVIKGRSTRRNLQHGVCSIGVSSAYLKRKILVWIKLLAKHIIERKYAGVV